MDFLIQAGPVDILFADEGLENLCSNQRQQKKQLGVKSAKKLQRRLADLMAAARVGDLVAGRPHPLKNDRAGQFAVDLDGGCRLVFEPAHDPPPSRDDGSIDWDAVATVRIVFIGDYHD
jgi:proteic killer suppression protein